MDFIFLSPGQLPQQDFALGLCSRNHHGKRETSLQFAEQWIRGGRCLMLRRLPGK